LPGQHLEHLVLEGKINGEFDDTAIAAIRFKCPVIVQILEWSVEIIDMDFAWPQLLDARRERFAQTFKADDHVSDHQARAIRTYPRRHHPRQKFCIMGDVGD